jgi:hypothetical protein
MDWDYDIAAFFQVMLIFSQDPVHRPFVEPDIRILRFLNSFACPLANTAFSNRSRRASDSPLQYLFPASRGRNI